MTTPKTTIGVFNDYTDSHLVTVEELKELMMSTAYTPQQLCDWRYSTCLSRFSYDPYSGGKIDWRKVRDYLTR